MEPLGRRTFRYMKLQFPELPKPVQVDRICLNQSVYPVDMKASAFSCSDPLLNRIYETAKYTIQLSMLDHLVDCLGGKLLVDGVADLVEAHPHVGAERLHLLLYQEC